MSDTIITEPTPIPPATVPSGTAPEPRPRFAFLCEHRRVLLTAVVAQVMLLAGVGLLVSQHSLHETEDKLTSTSKTLRFTKADLAVTKDNLDATESSLESTKAELTASQNQVAACETQVETSKHITNAELALEKAKQASLWTYESYADEAQAEIDAADELLDANGMESIWEMYDLCAPETSGT